MSIMFQGIYNILFRDLVRTYRVLPSGLRRGIVALFGLMVLLAFVELATVVNLAQQVGSRPGTDDYLALIDYNVAQLVAALQMGAEAHG